MKLFKIICRYRYIKKWRKFRDFCMNEKNSTKSIKDLIVSINGVQRFSVSFGWTVDIDLRMDNGVCFYSYDRVHEQDAIRDLAIAIYNHFINKI